MSLYKLIYFLYTQRHKLTVQTNEKKFELMKYGNDWALKCIEYKNFYTDIISQVDWVKDFGISLLSNETFRKILPKMHKFIDNWHLYV